MLNTKEENIEYRNNLQKNMVQILQSTVQESVHEYYEKLKKCIISSLPNSTKKTDKEKSGILSQETIELIKRRHDLQNKKPLTRDEKQNSKCYISK